MFCLIEYFPLLQKSPILKIIQTEIVFASSNEHYCLIDYTEACNLLILFEVLSELYFCKRFFRTIQDLPQSLKIKEEQSMAVVDNYWLWDHHDAQQLFLTHTIHPHRGHQRNVVLELEDFTSVLRRCDIPNNELSDRCGSQDQPSVFNQLHDHYYQ